MLTFIIIGMLCNSQGCYWAKINGQVTYANYSNCQIQAKKVKEVSIMYFETACMVAE